MAKKRGNNEGTIHRLKSGTWRVQLTQKGRRISKTFRYKEECQEWKNRMLLEFDNGLSLAALSQTVEEYLTSWLSASRLSWRESTYGSYASNVKAMIIPHIGKIRLKDFRPEHIQRLYELLTKSGVKVHGIRKVHTILHGAFAQALRMGVVRSNPVSSIKQPRKPDKEMSIWDQFQANQFLVTTSDHRWHALFHLALTTGMRQMELLGLKWGDVDWVRKFIKIERQLLRKPEENIQYISPKTRTGRRQIAMGSQTLQVMRYHFDQQQAEKQAAGDKWTDNGLVFTNSFGGPINYRNLVRDFKHLIQRAGLPDIRFHDLRHTAASLMLNQNIPPIVVSKRLGHARVSITLDIYGHLVPDIQEEAAQMIDDLITPIRLHTVAHDRA